MFLSGMLISTGVVKNIFLLGCVVMASSRCWSFSRYSYYTPRLPVFCLFYHEFFLKCPLGDLIWKNKIIASQDIPQQNNLLGPFGYVDFKRECQTHFSYWLRCYGTFMMSAGATAEILTICHDFQCFCLFYHEFLLKIKFDI